MGKHSIEETPLERVERLVVELSSPVAGKEYLMYIQSSNGYGMTHVGYGALHRSGSPMRLLGYFKGVRVVSIEKN